MPSSGGGRKGTVIRLAAGSSMLNTSKFSLLQDVREDMSALVDEIQSVEGPSTKAQKDKSPDVANLIRPNKFVGRKSKGKSSSIPKGFKVGPNRSLSRLGPLGEFPPNIPHTSISKPKGFGIGQPKKPLDMVKPVRPSAREFGPTTLGAELGNNMQVDEPPPPPNIEVSIDDPGMIDRPLNLFDDKAPGVNTGDGAPQSL